MRKVVGIMEVLVAYDMRNAHSHKPLPERVKLVPSEAGITGGVRLGTSGWKLCSRGRVLPGPDERVGFS